MTKEIKTENEVNDNKLKPNESNTRALVIVGIFVALFICLIAYEIASRK